ncbi:biotin--[acetyl-CoA-carboxylase] ligase [Oceanomicrobium pacificus]|uniref:biotin--[biotin carboxyl-carrier protein] ligase n=1 Tax=Oceanomicrobium pacificus TaxID=2692916 RepID=A0A6B0TX66_9RHOB|nr:biotin--[acetyl-CoA-carboxylase] ligase [Oceanomicrobium pacificus]MXU65613.1 biotin--[acetyl-CoA-carboxylase] ligase [Oceanomicrobium pacificus]
MAAWPEGIGRDLLGTVDSTNAEALRQAAAGRRAPGWILARAQSGGRGRRGRAWSSPEGNFFATYLGFPEGGPQMAALRSYAAALALRDALVEVTGRAPLFSLKWPNDVLLSGRKLAGILLEHTAEAGGALAVGIGVNLRHAPTAGALEPGALLPATLTEAVTPAPTPEAFLDALAPAFDRWDRQLATYGFAPLRTAWLDNAARLGEVITAKLPDRAITGIFESIDADGSLVLNTEAGRVTLAAAELHFATEGRV